MPVRAAGPAGGEGGDYAAVKVLVPGMERGAYLLIPCVDAADLACDGVDGPVDGSRAVVDERVDLRRQDWLAKRVEGLVLAQLRDCASRGHGGEYTLNSKIIFRALSGRALCLAMALDSKIEPDAVLSTGICPEQ